MKKTSLLLRLLPLLIPIQGLCDDAHEPATQGQGAWGQYYGAPIIVRAAEDTQQIELQFSEQEEFTLWKKSGEYWMRIPEGKEHIEMYNLADTGCNIEREKITDKTFPYDTRLHWVLHSNNSDKDHCQHNDTRIFKKDVTKSVQITQKDNTPEITINPDTLFQYQANLPSNYQVSYYVSSNHRFLILKPVSLDHMYGEKPPTLLPYAPELLVIDLERKKSHRIAFAGFQNLSSVAIDNNDLLLSFNNADSNHTGFGDLWRLDLTHLTMLPIEGWQSSACGSANIKMVRDRLESTTDTYTACGGNYGHHQAIFLNRSTLQSVYADGLLGDGDFGDSRIETLFNPEQRHYSEPTISADYQIIAQKNHIHLKPIPLEKTWPLRLSAAPENSTDISSQNSNNTVMLDAWLENRTLNIEIKEPKLQQGDQQNNQQSHTIKLALHVGLGDATNTNNDREKRKNTEPAFLDITYVIDTVKGSSLLMDKNSLSAPGIPTDLFELLEQKCCRYQTIKNNETVLTHQITMDLNDYPIKSLAESVGLKISLMDKQNNELFSTRHTRHRSQHGGWNYFENLSRVLRGTWGETPLANNIAQDNFNYAVSLYDKIYLYDKTSPRFIAYQPPKVDEHKLQSLMTELKSINDEDMKAFNSNANRLHKIYYRQMASGWRVYYLFNAGYATESGEYLLVTDYSAEGDFLQATEPMEIHFNCYRCDDSPPDYNKITLYRLQNNMELIVVDEVQALLNTDNLKWLPTEGSPDNTITQLSKADATLPAELEAPSQSYGHITEAPFRIQSDQKLNDELPILSNAPYVEPLNGIIFKDIDMERCVSYFLKEAYIDNPTLDASHIESLDCSSHPIKNIGDLAHFSQLKKLSLALAPENNLEEIRALKNLEELTVEGDNIDISKLKGTTIPTLTITTPTIDLTALPQLTHLKKLKLTITGAQEWAEDNVVYSNTVNELDYTGKKTGELLYHFPALKQVTLSNLDILASSCPASNAIETLIIKSITWKPISAKCYPNLRQFSVNSQTTNLLSDGPFLHLTHLKSPEFNKEIKEQAPTLTSLTTGIILEMLPDTIEELTMQATNRDAVCPGGSNLSDIKKARLTCHLLSQGYGNLPTIFAQYEILENTANRASPHYRLKSAKVDLKSKADIKDVWPSYDEEKTKKDFATIEDIEITGVSGTGFSALFADMPALKSIKASSYNSYIDSSYIFTLPPLPNLTSLSIGSFSRMDLSALESSKIESLEIKAKEGQKTELTLNIKMLKNLVNLDLGYGFTIAPAAMPCSLTTVRAYYAGTPDEKPDDCFAPTKMIISGTEVDASDKAYQALLSSTPNTILYESTTPSSRIWKKTDVDYFFAQRPDLLDHKENVISDCNIYSLKYPELHQQGYFRGNCVVDKVAQSTAL